VIVGAAGTTIGTSWVARIWINVLGTIATALGTTATADDEDEWTFFDKGTWATTFEDDDEVTFFVLQAGDAFKWRFRLASSAKLHEQQRQRNDDEVTFFILQAGDAFKWSLRLASSAKLHEQQRQRWDDIVQW